ncbi:MAG: hypothetical protein Q8M38_01135 [Phenylobacterium sp.]|nr:hypothetical protein [Phenylobacterium sp.]
MKPIWIVGCFFLAGCAPVMKAQTAMIADLGVKDALAGYERARSGGDPLDQCVKAKLVAIAYEEAHDPANAGAWRAREREDCQSAFAALGGGATGPGR